MYFGQTCKDEFHFLPVDKHQRFLQFDNLILGVCFQAYLNYPKNEMFISFQYLKEEVGDEDDLLRMMRMKVSYKLIL